MDEDTALRLIEVVEGLETHVTDLETTVKSLISAIDHEELGLIPAINNLQMTISLQD